MSAVIVQVADAVVASLNAAQFSVSFHAARKYRPVHDLAELNELRVTVVPKAMTITTAARQVSEFDCTVDIGVQQKVAADALEPPDAVMSVAQEIIDHLRSHQLDDLPEARWLKVESEPIFVPELLEQHHVLTAVISVTYRLWR